MPDCWRGSTALITGASRGIGAAFADLLAERGADLVVVARDRDALEQVAARVRARGVRAEVVPADLGDSGAPAAIEREVARRGLTVDHLLNNAAIGVHGRFHEVYAAAHPEVINVNVRAPTELAARFLPGMVARRRGGILNVASTAGFQGLAWIPVYSATKAYVVTWNEAVWAGLRGTGVRACCLCPGLVDTPFFDYNRWPVRPPPFGIQSAETVARAGLKGYEEDRCLVYSSLPFALTAWSTRLVPRAVAARIGARYTRGRDR